MTAKVRCRNMNHGRSNVLIRHCTDCGETLNATVRNSCNEQLHAERRKHRNLFCHDCGKSLTTSTRPK
ncbi:MAG: hypothetical protein KF681_02270 [Bdellovibrionaceae bacterium]|nr:hypothetical protein [Pseudobdellovibrionaceae bacterium]